VVLREEDVSGPDVTIDDFERTSLGSQDINSTWVRATTVDVYGSTPGHRNLKKLEV
jgi:hypothetical protein